MAELRLIFDPASGVTAEEFVRQWTADQDLQRHATATLERLPQTAFGDPVWMAVLAAIALGVPSNALWDAIKYTYARLAQSQQREPAETEFVHIKEPDGTEITLLRIRR
jgi:hypothetical protein